MPMGYPFDSQVADSVPVLPENGMDCLSPLLVGVGFLGHLWSKHFQKLSWEDESFICVELHPSGRKVPFPLNKSWKRCRWRLSRVRSKASGQSFCSVEEVSPAAHQASCSPSVHCAWGPHGRGPCCGGMKSMRAPLAKSV